MIELQCMYYKICELHLDTHKYYPISEMYIYFMLMTLIYYLKNKYHKSNSNMLHAYCKKSYIDIYIYELNHLHCISLYIINLNCSIMELFWRPVHFNTPSAT
jgi:hypothetical protein